VGGYDPWRRYCLVGVLPMKEELTNPNLYQGHTRKWWAETLGLSKAAFNHRVSKYCWEKAVAMGGKQRGWESKKIKTYPFNGKDLSVSQISAEIGVSYDYLWGNIKKFGFEKAVGMRPRPRAEAKRATINVVELKKILKNSFVEEDKEKSKSGFGRFNTRIFRENIAKRITSAETKKESKSFSRQSSFTKNLNLVARIGMKRGQIICHERGEPATPRICSRCYNNCFAGMML